MDTMIYTPTNAAEAKQFTGPGSLSYGNVPPSQLTPPSENGSQPQINDSKTYDNGKKVVPSYLLDPVLVTKANWKQTLVDGGYYTAKQLGQ